MLGRDGFIQGYNAQISVDGSAQIILAHRLSDNPSDQDALVALVDAFKRNTGRKPSEVSPDAGLCSEAGRRPRLKGCSAAGIRLNLQNGLPHLLGLSPPVEGGALTGSALAVIRQAVWKATISTAADLRDTAAGAVGAS
jgi:hypothetical protein